MIGKTSGRNASSVQHEPMHVGPESPINIGSCTLGPNTGKNYSLTLADLNTHYIAIGGSGSGKSVSAKHVLEHFLLYKIPVVVLDVLGDLTGLCVPDTDHARRVLGTTPAPFQASDEAIRHGRTMASQLEGKIVGRILTPCSNAGERLAIPPVSKRPQNWNELHDTDLDYLTLQADTVAANFLKRLGMGSRRAGDGPDLARGIITDVLLESWGQDMSFDGKKGVMDFVEQLNSWGAPPLPTDAMNKIRSLSGGLLSGAEALWLDGTPLDFDELLRPIDGRTPVVSIYLHGTSPERIPWVVSQVIFGLSAWASRQGVITGIPRVGLMIDELRGEQGANAILPKAVYKSPSGDAIRRLLRQGRHWGISAICGTQFPTDVDTATFSNFSSRMIGRLTDENAIKAAMSGADTGDEKRKSLVVGSIQKARANSLLAIQRTGYFDRVQTHCLGTTHPKILPEKIKLLYEHGFAWKKTAASKTKDRRESLVRELERIATAYQDALDPKQVEWLRKLADYHRK